jgi:dehydrogenase/reductase SDR family protein 12
VTAAAGLADGLLEATVVGGFSRVGLAVRERLLPEFAAPLPPLAGQTVLVTGATSGIGLAAATGLAGLGASVHFLARDRGRAQAALGRIAAAGGEPVSYGLADLDDLDSVRRFAADFLSGHDRLDVLVHNAGAIHQDYGVSPAGLEQTVAGQVVAPFALTRDLMPALRDASSARVITVSSAGMYTQPLDPGLLSRGPEGYRGVTAYARAKRAQVALSGAWARRPCAAGVAFHSMHPGWARTPGLAAALPGFTGVMRPLLRSPEQGADTILWLAAADPRALGSGRFWHDRRPRPEYPLPWTAGADPAGAALELWEHVAAAAGR